MSFLGGKFCRTTIALVSFLCSNLANWITRSVRVLNACIIPVIAKSEHILEKIFVGCGIIFQAFWFNQLSKVKAGLVLCEEIVKKFENSA